MKLVLRIALIVAGIAILVVIIGILAHAWTEKIEPGRVDAPPAIALEDVLEVTLEEKPRVERAAGTIRARRETTVSTRILATVTTVNVRSGDWVEEGGVLATLDDRDLRSRVEQAQRTVEAHEARLRDLETETNRARELYEAGALARAELDRLEAGRQAALAEREGANRRLDEAETSLSYAIIEAPIAGRVIDRYTEPGDIVTPGTPIVRLYDPESLRLEADVRESVAARLARGMELEAHIEAIGDTYPVTVEEIVPHSDAGSRTFVVKASLPPAEMLYPGMFGRLLIPVGTADRLYIPPGAVSRMGQLEFVLAVEEGRPVRRFIRTGETRGDGWLEVMSGLQPGERILAQGAEK